MARLADVLAHAVSGWWRRAWWDVIGASLSAIGLPLIAHLLAPPSNAPINWNLALGGGIVGGFSIAAVRFIAHFWSAPSELAEEEMRDLSRSYERVVSERDALRRESGVANATPRAMLHLGGLERNDGIITGKSWHWRLPVHIEGSPARNLEVRLEALEPLPTNWPYPWRPPYPARHEPTGATVLVESSAPTEWFELLMYVHAHYPNENGSPKLLVAGLDTHQLLHDPAYFEAEQGTQWRMRYRIRCDNGDPQYVRFLVTVHADFVMVERND